MDQLLNGEELLKRGVLSKTILPLAIMSMLAFNIHQAASVKQPPQIQWSRAYGGGVEEDYAMCVIQTSDGGYALAGYTASLGAGGMDFLLIKTDENGNMEWNQTYGGSEWDIAYSVIQTSDGGYALTGSTVPEGGGSQDAWLVKTDENGNAEWNQTYDGPTSSDYTKSVVQTSDGGYAIAGVSMRAGRSWDVWLIKTDTAGNMEWNKNFGGAEADVGETVVQTDDGGFAIAGSTSSFSEGPWDFWLIKTDSAGNMQWDRKIGGPEAQHLNSMSQTGDGGYILAGHNYTGGVGADFWWVKTDSSGIVEWNQTFGGGNYDYANSAVQAYDGGYAIAGMTESFGAGSYDFCLVKTDSTGNIEWYQTCGGIDSDTGESVIQTNDGGYAMAGGTQVFQTPYYNWEAWLVKLATSYNIAVTDVSLGKTVVGEGYNMTIEVAVKNNGSYTETFNVTVYVDQNTTTVGDEIALETQNVTLTPGGAATLTFTWDTMGVVKGNYTISAYARPLAGEKLTTDNLLADGWVFVTLPGDFDADRDVDIYDIVMIADAYDSEEGDPRYFAEGDFDNDGDIDIYDIVIAADNYDTSW